MSEFGGRAKRTTIKDVAKLAGTSVATVSYVFGNAQNRYITREMRERVVDAARELGYVKNSLASGLKGKNIGIIAVLTPQFENHFFVSIIGAIESIANEKGYVLSTCNTFDDPGRERDLIERMLKLNVDGYLIIPTHLGAENTEQIRAYGIPCVSIERPLDEVTEYDFISSDNFHSTYQLTNEIVARGHKRIALAYWDTPISNLKERLYGYKQSLADAGLDFDPDLVLSASITHQEGARVTTRILSDPTITATLYGHYLLAEGGIKYMREEEISIPERMSVALVGRPKWLEMSEMQFAHVSQPSVEIGRVAAEILFDKLQTGNRQKTAGIHKKIPGIVRLGQSIKSL